MKNMLEKQIEERVGTYAKEQKGYEHRPMDWRDKLILWTDVVVAILTVMLGGL